MMKLKDVFAAVLKTLTKPAQPQEVKSASEVPQEVASMTTEIADIHERVGPVLQSGTVADAIVEAIQELNQDVMLVDRGSYVRVLVPRRCVVTREAIERHLGRPFRFPGEMEVIMSAFKGVMRTTNDEGVWELKEHPA